MITKRLYIVAIALALGFSTLVCKQALAHCQIPCGIYDDEVRAKLMSEHITTVEKSMKQIIEISASEKPDYNQLVRWVQNKEDHVGEFSEIVTYYFMAQRVKPAKESEKDAHAAYVRQVTLLHRMLVTAMKAKQTTDLSHIAELRSLLHDFTQAYEGLNHEHEKPGKKD